MTATYWTALAAASLAAATTGAGIYATRHFEDWSLRNASYFMSFAAGVLVAASFLHLIPVSLAINAGAAFYLLAGFLALYVFNWFVEVFLCGREARIDYGIGLVPLIGIGLHSFVDGFVYSITFEVSLPTGVLAATGMVLHEFPEGIITYLMLVRAGFRDRVALGLAFTAAALTTPLGTLLSYPFIRQVQEPLLGALLALSAGALVYVGATHLLPHAQEEHRRLNLLALGLGVAVAVAIVLSGA